MRRGKASRASPRRGAIKKSKAPATEKAHHITITKRRILINSHQHCFTIIIISSFIASNNSNTNNNDEPRNSHGHHHSGRPTGRVPS